MKINKALATVLLLIVFPAFAFGQLWKPYADSVKYFTSKGIATKAFENYLKAKELTSGEAVFTDTITPALKNLAVLYYNSREPKQAVVVCDEIRRVTAGTYSELNTDYAWACNMLGAIYNVSGKLDTAETLHLKAKAIREKLLGDKDPFYAQSCNNLGALYRDIGRYDMAEPLLLAAKEIREKLTPAKQNDPFAITCVSLANLYRDMGQYEKSESFYLQAKERRAISGKESRDYASSCNILADLYSYMSKYDEAEKLYLEAKGIRAKLDSGGYEYGQSCNNLASLYREMGFYQKAEPLALEAKAIYEEELDEDDPSRTIQLNNLGELYYAMEKYKEATSFFLQARKAWERELGKEHPYSIGNTEALARVYRNMNETEKASRLFSAATRMKYEQLNKVFGFTSEREKQLYLENINGSSDECLSFYYKKISHNKAGESYTLSLLNRSLILSSSQQAREVIYNSKDSSLIGKFNEWMASKQQLAALYSQGGTAKPEQVKLLEEKAGALEKDMSRSSSVFKNIQRKAGWQDIRQKLAGTEAAIEFVTFRLYENNRWTDTVLYAALLLRKEMPEPLFVLLFEKRQLTSLLRSQGADEIRSVNQLYNSPACYELAWKPVEKFLTGIRKIYFAPAGELFGISFDALRMNDGRVLSDKYRLIQLTTTATILNQSPLIISRKDDIRVYGGIVYDADTAALKEAVTAYHNVPVISRSLPDDLSRGKNFRFLPGTRKEAETIREQANKSGLAVSVLSGIEASEESFKSLNGRNSPVVLHIATHGFFFPDPGDDKRDTLLKKFEISGKPFRESGDPLLRAGLLFAGANNTWRGKAASKIEDGVLTAYEVAAMYLPDTKLAVLSACETAQGDVSGTEGVYGLQRAFRIAGVQNLVMSLWKVPDEETAEFMQFFYNNIFQQQPVADAFYNAQNSMKKLYGNEPYKWAAWIMTR